MTNETQSQPGVEEQKPEQEKPGWVLVVEAIPDPIDDAKHAAIALADFYGWLGKCIAREWKKRTGSNKKPVNAKKPEGP